MSNLTIQLIGGAWLVGTVGLALAALGFAVYFAVRRKWSYTMFLAVAAVVAVIANPVLNMLVFSKPAERYREQMLATAKAENCVGRSTEWLVTRFGKPAQIFKDGAVEHWWYTPGPWFIVHEDYVGFQVQHGTITQAYMQIN